MKLSRSQKRELIRIVLAGTLLLGLGVLLFCGVLPAVWYARLPFFLVPYFLVGFGVWRKAILNLAHGQLLDENFLMCIATIGAFVIREYPEAVGVMLFYRIGEYFEEKAAPSSVRYIQPPLLFSLSPLINVFC